MVKPTGRHACKKRVVALLCLFLIGNVARGTVLCFGADGHIEFESIFHEHCGDHVHTKDSEPNRPFLEAGHEQGTHCEPCVDVPVAVDLVKMSCAAKQNVESRVQYFAPFWYSNTHVNPEQLWWGKPHPATDTFLFTSYFTPLRTVILLA